MKLFTIKLLKCIKCETNKFMKVEACKIEEVEENLTEDKKEALLKIIRKDLETEDEISTFLSDFKEYSDVDAIEFISKEKEAENKMIDLFYKRNIIEGSIICVEGGDEKKIENGILKLL